jgi:hypothetical protein
MATPAKQWTQKSTSRLARNWRDSTHPSETANPSTAIEAHKQRFGLIVGVMRRGNRFQTMSLRPITESGVAGCTRTLLHGRSRAQVQLQDRVGNAS